MEGRTLTSWPSLQTDILNAGGNWVGEEVVVDGGLVTSRKPDDLDAFCAKAIEATDSRRTKVLRPSLAGKDVPDRLLWLVERVSAGGQFHHQRGDGTGHLAENSLVDVA